MARGTPAGAQARPLTLRKTVAGPQEAVFRAWTDPDALAAWFGGELARTLSAAVDLRVGGAYRITLQSGDQVGAVEGVYREVARPERLVYTWSWDRPRAEGRRESLVTVEFFDRGEQTEVVLTHEGLETEESLAFHDRGWSASLKQLGQAVQLLGPVKNFY